VSAAAAYVYLFRPVAGLHLSICKQPRSVSENMAAMEGANGVDLHETPPELPHLELSDQVFEISFHPSQDVVASALINGRVMV
jgi:hypothetical protein